MKNWRDAVLSKTATVREAMRTLSSSSMRVVLIVSGERLIGTVTDGDIRRGLLRDVHMEDSVSSVLNDTPSVARQGISKKDAFRMLDDLDLLAIPVVDSDGRLLELLTLSSLMHADRKPNPVFIMAGGFGSRLRPLTENCPKPMLPVGDKPLLQHQIEQLIRQGFTEFYISTHYMPDRIRDYFGNGSDRNVSINYVHEIEPLGTGGALGLLPDNLSDHHLLMMNGDVLTDLDFSELIDSQSKHNSDIVVCTRELEHNVPYGVVETSGATIIDIVEKPTYRYEISSGIYLLSSDCVKSVAKNQKLDMPSLFKKRIKKGKTLATYVHRGYWLDIGSPLDYEKAQTDIQSLDL